VFLWYIPISIADVLLGWLQVHSYEVHPRLGHLCTGSIPARLQLAALYAATGSLLPEPGSQVTGAQIAMQLVRQCWGTKPLSPSELQQLVSVGTLGGHMAAALRLLVHELQASGCQLNDLHFPDGAPDHAQAPKLNPDWAQAYLQEQEAQGNHNPRLLLQPGEEQRVLGHLRAVEGPPLWKRLLQYRAVHVPECPVSDNFVFTTEALLLNLVDGQADKASGNVDSYPAAPPYPLATSNSTPLQREMHAELKDSWRVHHSLPAPTVVKPGAKECIQLALVSCLPSSCRIEVWLLCGFVRPHNVHLHATEDDTGLRSMP
jgi:hypothetical protein